MPREAPDPATSAPWSIDQTLDRMADLEDQLAQAIDPLLEVGDRASETKWAYRDGIRQAIEAGVIDGVSNQQARDAKIRAYQTSPGVTVADLGREADRWANRLLTTNTAVKALIKQADLTQSLHVTAREGAP